MSYVSGPREPLLGETIGDNLDRVAAAHPDVECLVSRHQELRYASTSFPMTVTGKIRTVEMREISTQRLGLDAAASIETA